MHKRALGTPCEILGLQLIHPEGSGRTLLEVGAPGGKQHENLVPRWETLPWQMDGDQTRVPGAAEDELRPSYVTEEHLFISDEYTQNHQLAADL